MKKLSAIFLLLISFSLSAQATNWLQVQGSEAPGAGAFRLVGFLQPTYTSIVADPLDNLQGALAADNGRMSALNLNWPNLEHAKEFQVMRAAVAARGTLSHEINYLVSLDAGQNGTTYYRDIMLTDASLSFNGIPGARVRAGLFKLPTSEEALQMVNTSSAYVYNSNAVLYLLVGLPVQAKGVVNPNGTTPAQLTGGFSGFRDWGVQVYDWFNRGSWEHSYAVMLSNGGEIENLQDSDTHKDLTWRLQSSYVFSGSGANREDVSIYVWRQNGTRLFGGQYFTLVRQGAGAKYLRGKYRVSSEYLSAKGMIVGGQAPPLAGQPFSVGVNEQAEGGYIEGGWRFLPEWEADLRYDTLHFMTVNAANSRKFDTTTLGVQYLTRCSSFSKIN